MRSVAVALPRTTGTPDAKVTFAGHVMVGGVVSLATPKPGPGQADAPGECLQRDATLPAVSRIVRSATVAAHASS